MFNCFHKHMFLKRNEMSWSHFYCCDYVTAVKPSLYFKAVYCVLLNFSRNVNHSFSKNDWHKAISVIWTSISCTEVFGALFFFFSLLPQGALMHAEIFLTVGGKMYKIHYLLYINFHSAACKNTYHITPTVFVHTAEIMMQTKPSHYASLNCTYFKSLHLISCTKTI